MTNLAHLFFERVLLDTNVLNSVLTAPKSSELQQQFLDLALNSELNICDTVYYEFLRNCSLQTYRERVSKLDEIKPALHHLRDNADYFKTVWFLYLYALRNDPGKLLSIELQDIQIASCAIHEKIDNILTENYRDFPSELFDSTLLEVKQKKFYVMKFNRTKAQELWTELIASN